MKDYNNQEKYLAHCKDNDDEAIVEVDNYPFGIILYSWSGQFIGKRININLYSGKQIALHEAIALRMIW